MRYFCIMTGLRGCYMPDSSYAVAVKTRRELKSALLSMRDDYDVDEPEFSPGYYRATDREVASVAAALWRRRHTDRDSHLSTVIPYGTNGCCGIQVNPISRTEYLEIQAQED